MDIQRGYAWGGKPHTVRFSSPNPTFSACCQWVWTFVPFGLRGRDSPMAWLRQYQYNLHSPLQPGVVKALLLVLRSSAALALAAVLRTVHSHADCALAHGGARNRSANQPLADCKPELRRSGAEERGGSGGNFPRMRQPWRNTSASFAKKGGRGRRIAPHEPNEPHAIKRGHTKSKIPPWRAPGRGGGVSPHKKSVTPQNIKINRPANCTQKNAAPESEAADGAKLFIWLWKGHR